MYNKKSLFGLLPKVDDLLKEEVVQHLLEKIPRALVVESVRESIEEIRNKILSLQEDEISEFTIEDNALLQTIQSKAHMKYTMNLKKVINGTGVVLHTNLGRALLSDRIKEEVWAIASGYSNLEMDLQIGQRGSRYAHVEGILRQLTGAEDALVVNNNAAAVLLVLGTVANHKEVIVSRGQLVEIGGAFRIPEVMEQSGAKLREVGTTNKTHLEDYKNAISEETAALLKVHTSNYKILGFTKEVTLPELVELGKEYHLPVIEDIGSGTLIDFAKYGLEKEPTIQESVRAGADIVTFSGDKLLGGPQAGIIVGRKKYIEHMKKNPITRAFRVDKLTLAALEATLRIYLEEDKAVRYIPTLQMLTMKHEEIELKAEKLFKRIEGKFKAVSIKKITGYSQVGGGSMPLTNLPTMLIAIKSNDLSTSVIERKLRGYKMPIIGRIHEDQFILDVRTIREEEFAIIFDALTSIFNT